MNDPRTQGPVHAQVFIEGKPVSWEMMSLTLSDAVGRIPRCTAIVNSALGPDVDKGMLGHSVKVELTRGVAKRSVCGIVAGIQSLDEHEGGYYEVEIVAAVWMLAQGRDSRVYQGLTVPELVQQMFAEFLSPQMRTVRLELSKSYSKHEYLVQHRESHWEFMTRLCDVEGIYFYFDYDSDDEREILVLADSNEQRQPVDESTGGVLLYEREESRRASANVAYAFTSNTSMGATDAVVVGYDWTHPSLTIREEQAGHSPWNEPSMQLYDHDLAVRYHDYDGGSGAYRSNSAKRRVSLDRERLHLERQAWSVQTTSVVVRPGYTVELVGTDGGDNRYLVLSIAGIYHGSAQGGEYSASLEIVPLEVPYRPPLPLRRSMPGPETATVVGPDGEEIHTDQHGRIKVQFHWDRQG